MAIPATFLRVATLGASALVAILVVIAPVEPKSAPRVQADPVFDLLHRKGAMKLRSRQAGTALLTLGNGAPGDVARGTFRVRNAGDRPFRVVLLRGDLMETLGPNGGSVANALVLRIDQLRGSGARTTRYAGPLTALSRLRLGRWPRGAVRRYRFILSFPDSGVPASASAGDNVYQGSSVEFNLLSIARAL